MWVDEFAGFLAKTSDVPGLKGQPPKQIATILLHKALNPDGTGHSLNFEPPIQIIELVGPKSLYRMYDGKHSAAEGDWWFESKLVAKAVELASRRTGFDAYDRHAYALKLLRAAMCTHPEWTNYSDIARLDLAHGRRVPAITGRSSPRALKMPDAEMERVLGQLPISGEMQYFIPHDFFKAIWVQKVQRNSPNWPFS